MDQDLLTSRRLKLQAELEKILGSDHVYFEPPESVKMQYPCIVYSRASADQKYADNGLYSYVQRYQVVCIEVNPDSSLIGKMLELPLCSYNRSYNADNLKHDLFYVYF